MNVFLNYPISGISTELHSVVVIKNLLNMIKNIILMHSSFSLDS